MEGPADRLSIRWFLGYDLHEPLPDHSSLTRIRERYGLPVFRRFFERIVEVSRSDPDVTRLGKGETRLGYRARYIVDGGN